MSFPTNIQRTTNLSHLINGPNDAAFLVIEGIMRQLYADARGYKRTVCDIEEEGIPKHYASECAMSILHDIKKFMRNNPDADHIEIALEVIRLHGGFEGSTSKELLTSEETEPITYQGPIYAKGLSKPL